MKFHKRFERLGKFNFRQKCTHHLHSLRIGPHSCGPSEKLFFLFFFIVFLEKKFVKLSEIGS